MTTEKLQFPPFLLDTVNVTLWRGQQVIPLPPKAFDALQYLATHSERLVTSEELLSALWPDVKVNPGVLKVRIRQIRKALGDDAASPRFIGTVHRRGYRFIAPVTTAPPVSSSRFQVSGSKSDPAPNTQHPTPPLVGRKTELAQLYNLLEKALHGERQIVFVTGEPGIGKTTLIEAFLCGVRSREEFGVQNSEPRTLNTEPPSTPNLWLGRGQCIEQYGPGEPYMPILEALGRLCREPDGERLIVLLHQHAPMWLVQLPTLLPAVEQEVLQRQTQGATRERMLREMGEAIDAITAEHPLVLCLEDLHWSDASTLELLALLARRCEPARLLVIGTYRPVDVIVQEHPLRAVKQELQLHGLCAELPLGLLSEMQVVEYLVMRFPVGAQHTAPLQELAHRLYCRTDGNPLFMVIAVEDLIAQKVLVQHAGQWAVQDELAAIETRVPDNLQQLIERQIERLSAEDRRLLEGASVAGMEFSSAAVAAGVETETAIVEERCEGLARQAHFLRTSSPADWPDGTVAAHYSFLHGLYQEVLYEHIPAGRRQRLHQRIGEREEQAYGERTREIAAALAVHFEQGREYLRAVQYLYQAGENATRRNTHQEAITHFTKARELLQTLADTPERAQQELTLQVALALPLALTKGFAALEVEAVHTRALDLCQQIGETLQLFPALWGARLFYLLRGELQTARQLAERLIPLAQQAQDSALLLEAHFGLGSVLYSLGEVIAAHAHFEQALALYDPRQRRSTIARYGGDVGAFSLSSLLAQVLWLLGYTDQARKRSREAQTLAQEIDHPLSTAVVWIRNIEIHQFLHEAQAVQQQAEAVIALCNEHGFLAFLALGIVQRGWALAEQGQAEEGIQQIQQGMAAHRTTRMELYRPYHLALLAEACRKAGQVEEGLTALAEALAVVDRTGEGMYEAELYRLKGTLTLQSRQVEGESKTSHGQVKTGQGKSAVTSTHPATPSTHAEAEAEACFLKAIEIAQHQQAKSLELRATMSLARLWQQQGKRKESHEMLAEIYGWFTEGFDTKDLQEAKALIKELRLP